ncbi:MAG: translation elongation factor Ts [Bacteroidales bacterium]|jgi:elongation factor Ts|nr:translation elongation factor Ts [Bacteroidales bacterium]
MANITAADVNKLRQMTGAGMMDCKKALIESDGDFEKAIDYLRKHGQKVAAKRADREATQGRVVAAVNDKEDFGCIVMLGCETDFVAESDDFKKVVDDLSCIALGNQPRSLEEFLAISFESKTVAEMITELTGKTGEKIEMTQYAFIDNKDAARVFAYNHHGNRLATLVGFSDASVKEEVGHNVAMQVAAMNPIATTANEFPEHVIAHERAIAVEQTIAEGKPADKAEMIAEGRLKKFFKENALDEQEYILDSKISVGQYVKNNGTSQIIGFRRVHVGA